MGGRSRHFKIRELERRPNDLSFTQQRRAEGFLASWQLSRRRRPGNMAGRTLLVASGLRLERGARARGRGFSADLAGAAAISGRENWLRAGAGGAHPPYDSVVGTKRRRHLSAQCRRTGLGG